MDDSNINDDSRQNLYNEFEAEVVKAGNQEAYFDENDLVEIFDYASDMDNYIVKMEVLFYGARHYPSSEVLATRRAWFYSSLGELEAASQLNDRLDSDSVLNRLLALHASGAGDTPQTRQCLDEIVESSNDLGDEELIQLVDYCADNNMLDWVAQARANVEAHCTYMPTYLYEWADRAEELGDLATARSLFEELTMTEPFTADFWMRLAGVHLAMGQGNEALGACDYALAIDDRYIDALRLKGRALYTLGRDKEEVSRIFREVLDHPDSTESDTTAYAAILMETGHSDRAAALLEETLSRNPLSQMPVDLLMTIDFDRAVPYILNISKQPAFERGSVITWAKEHVENTNVETASRLLEQFRHLIAGTPDVAFACGVWMAAKRYELVVGLMDDSHAALGVDVTDNLMAEIPYVAALAITGERNKALEHIDRINEATGGFETMRHGGEADVNRSAKVCLGLGAMHILHHLRTYISSGADITWPADPLAL